MKKCAALLALTWTLIVPQHNRPRQEFPTAEACEQEAKRVSPHWYICLPSDHVEHPDPMDPMADDPYEPLI